MAVLLQPPSKETGWSQPPKVSEQVRRLRLACFGLVPVWCR